MKSKIVVHNNKLHLAVEAEGPRFKSRGPLVFLRYFSSEMLQLATINLWQKISWRMEL
jgi:hypothetical protein